MLIPAHLYGKPNDLRYGISRGCGHLLRLRALYTVEVYSEVPDEPVGLRRAQHAAALIEVVYSSHQTEFGTGYFDKALKARLDIRLRDANLQPQERHFNDLNWWNKLDRRAALAELGSNLDRLINAPELTTFIGIGVEMHALFDMRMRHINTDYESVVTPDYIARSPFLRESITRFRDMIPERNAA